MRGGGGGGGHFWRVLSAGVIIVITSQVQLTPLTLFSTGFCHLRPVASFQVFLGGGKGVELKVWVG